MITVKTHKKIKRRTPKGETKIHIRKKKPSQAKCSKCGAKLNRKRLVPKKFKQLPKNQRRAERPLPHLCPSCMKRHLIEKARYV